MKLIPNRNRNANDLEKALPASVAALDGASDREIEAIVRKQKHANDIHWNIVASSYGFRG